MSGGIRRWAAAVRKVDDPSRVVVLENGGMVGGDGLQDHLKAEALAEALDSVKVTAINLTSSEARLGAGEVSQLSQLSRNKFVSTSLGSTPGLGIEPFVKRGPFLIGGAVSIQGGLAMLGPDPLGPESAAKALSDKAMAIGLVPILMLEGDREAATRIAQSSPLIRLIVFSQTGDPLAKPYVVGKTLLVTPGERGKFLVRLSYSRGRFVGETPIDLGPAVADDAYVGKVYAAYLRSVDRENLIASWPRKETAGFVGAEKCGSCHQSSYATWKGSKHSGAYRDLSAQGHGKDPDCVVCHVTGLGSTKGFKGLAGTPGLAFVGCESCHGPGAEHSANPNVFKMSKIGEASCKSCHEVENSPKFQFLTYWAQIKH
jgi:hypothetical protein